MLNLNGHLTNIRDSGFLHIVILRVPGVFISSGFPANFYPTFSVVISELWNLRLL